MQLAPDPAGRDIFDRLGERYDIIACAPDAVPAGPPDSDGLIVGWGAYAHIPTKARRVAFLQALKERSVPGSPVDRHYRVFRYPAVLIDCMSKQAVTSDSCMSQGGVCSGPGSDATTKACFAYPKERFKDNPMFVAAAFFVSEGRVGENPGGMRSGIPELALNQFERGHRHQSRVVLHFRDWR